MNSIWTKEFWLDTAERVIYTVCETAIGVIGGAAIISEVDWTLVLSACGLSAIATLIKCVMVNVNKGDGLDE